MRRLSPSSTQPRSTPEAQPRTRRGGHYNKLVEVSGGYGERVTEARQVLPALERAMKAVLVEKRQALLNVVCDVDTNAGGD